MKRTNRRPERYPVEGRHGAIQRWLACLALLTLGAGGGGALAAPKGKLLDKKGRDGRACARWCIHTETSRKPNDAQCAAQCVEAIKLGVTTPAVVACQTKYGEHAGRCIDMRLRLVPGAQPTIKKGRVPKRACSRMCRARKQRRFAACYEHCFDQVHRGYLNPAVLKCLRGARKDQADLACYRNLPRAEYLELVRMRKSAEAIDLLSMLYKRVAAFVHAQDGATDCRLPPAIACTPQGTPCANKDGRFPVDPKAWRAPGWTALRFELTEPHFYRYCLETKGNRFTLVAHGDLDCDGTWSRWSLSGTVVRDAELDVCSVKGDAEYIKTAPLE